MPLSYPKHVFLALLALAASSAGQRATTSPPAVSVPLVVRVQLDKRVPVKKGAAVRAHTLDPIYLENQLDVPAGTRVEGRVENVMPAPARVKRNAMLGGDFTPLRQAQIRFDHLINGHGELVPVEAALAQQGSEVVRFHSRNVRQPSLPKRAVGAVKTAGHNMITTVTAPGKSERLKKWFYMQLPWHPQAIDRGAEYDVTLLRPVPLTAGLAPLASSPNPLPLGKSLLLHARLCNELSSKTAKPGDPVTAVVTEPKLDENHKLEVPQGALLRGRVLRARAARSMGRNGSLRFTFDHIELPASAPTAISGVASAVESNRAREIELDNEGGARAQPSQGLLLPLTLGLLAANSLYEDEASLAHAGISSNGFGLIGRVVALSTGSHVVGGAIGAAATARMLYARFFAHGKDVIFPPATGIEVDMGATHVPRSSSGN